MIRAILASWAPGPIGPIELLVIIFFFVVVFVIPILLIVLLVRYILRNKRENVRLRLEVGKLADELQQMREQTKGGGKDKSSAESG